MMEPFMFHDSVLLSIVVSSSMSNESLLSRILPLIWIFHSLVVRFALKFPENEFEWLDCSPLRLPLVPTRNSQ